MGAPHASNTDREWYTEYRWKKGQEYKQQNGAITDKPKFAPVPKPTPAPKKKFLRKPLNKKPVAEEKEEPKPVAPKQTKQEVGGSMQKCQNRSRNQSLQQAQS